MQNVGTGRRFVAPRRSHREVAAGLDAIQMWCVVVEL
jgi:hypothetical protein